MTIEIRVPTLGESVTEATIGRWFKKAGDAVKADEPLVELETDKVTLEVNAPSAGVLAEIAAKDGETVGVGALLGQIADPAPRRRRATPSRRRAEPRVRSRARTGASRRSGPGPPSMPPSPAAAKIAADNGIDHGRHRRAPAIAARCSRATCWPSSHAPAPLRRPPRAASAPRAAPAPRRRARPRPPTDAEREERVRMTRLRQTIARRLKEAQNTAAMLTTFNEVDMSEVMALRARYKDVFEKKHGVKLGFMGFFVKAVVGA